MHERPLRPFSRRGVLRLAAGTALGAGLAASGMARRVGAQVPPAQVQLEELTLAGDTLAAGTLDGTVVSTAGVQLAPGAATGLYTSPLLRAAGPFTHVGVRWSGEQPAALEVAVRVSLDGAAWSTWHAVSVETHGRQTAGEVRGALVGVGRGVYVQLRVSFSASRGASRLTSARLTLLNTTDGPALPAADEALAVPDLGRGDLLRREHWGADEALRQKDGAEIWPRMYVPVKKLVVHHTATTNNYETPAEAAAEVRAIYAYHAVSLEWGDIGYNAIIDKWGNVYEGRHGRGRGRDREVLSTGVVAGHALEHNYGSTGIALLGTFTRPGENDEPGVRPTQALLSALADVLAWECERNNIDPLGSSDFLLVTDEWNRELDNLPGHRDCTSTICPGGYVYDLLPSIRAAVASRLRRPSGALTFVAHAGQHATMNSVERVQFDWGGQGTGRYRYLLEGWRRKPASEDVEYLAGFDASSQAAWRETELRSARLTSLLAEFAGPEAAIEPGRYTFHVLELDDSGRPGLQRDHTILVTVGDDRVPSVRIKSPADRARLPANQPVRFEASASDPEDGDVTHRLTWSSSRDGKLSDVAIFSKTLSAGEHTLTASATDSNGVVASASVVVTVG